MARPGRFHFLCASFTGYLGGMAFNYANSITIRALHAPYVTYGLQSTMEDAGSKTARKALHAPGKDIPTPVRLGLARN